eukprot:2791381-Rhodomonas_salina.4
MQHPILTWHMLLPGGRRERGKERERARERGISLRACYAVSYTGIAYDAISYLEQLWGQIEEVAAPTVLLCASYAMSGSDLAYHPTMVLRTCFAMSGTDVAYGPTRWKKRTQSYWSRSAR